jgi:hypothetical protein
MEEAEPGAAPEPRWQSSPVEHWSKNLRLEIPIEQFHRLPHNVDYRFEYIDGTAQIRPRPHVSDAFLTIPDPSNQPAGTVEEETSIRPLAEVDWELLPSLFPGCARLSRLHAQRRRWPARRIGVPGRRRSPKWRDRGRGAGDSPFPPPDA